MATATFDRFADAFAFWNPLVNRRHYPALLDDFLTPSSAAALDVGCGPGYLARYLATRSDHVVGLDLSPRMVALAEQARQRDACPNVRFVVGDVLAAPFADGAFDVVVSDCALHDMPLDAALITIRRLVRPGGRLMLRDLVTRSSRLAQSPAYQLLRTVRKAPAYVKRHGPQTAWRLLKFEAHPAWLRHRASGLRLTPAAFEARYGQVFPGGRFVHFGWASAVFWIRPKNEDTL